MGTVTVDWNGHPVEAADPAPLADWTPQFGEATVRRTEQAAAAVVRIGAAVDRGPLVLIAQLLQRAEGVASSEIEAIASPARAVAFAQAAGVDPGGDAEWVADNIAVVLDAIADRRPIDDTVLWDWHRRLMRHGRLDGAHIGAWRDRLGWIGGHSPRVAAHVGAPEDRISGHMDDLYGFLARTDLDPITVAAISHGQFETVHPFADGNGRIGRVLISNQLARRCDVSVPPPLSLQIRRDVGGYQSGLTLYRDGMYDAWVHWFADATIAAAEIAETVISDAATIVAAWRDAVSGLRSDAAARRLVEELPAHPVVAAHTVAGLCGVSEPAARSAIAQLVDARVLEQIDLTEPVAGPRRRWYAATALLDLVG